MFLSLFLSFSLSVSLFFENEERPQIVTLKGAHSQRHEGSSNEDAGSFHLYRIAVIDLGEAIFFSERLRLDEPLMSHYKYSNSLAVCAVCV